MEDDGKSREELLAELREARDRLASMAARLGETIAANAGRAPNLGGDPNGVATGASKRDKGHFQPGTEGWYRTLFDSIDEGLCTIQVLFDPLGQPVDYRFLEVNSAFEKQTGLKDAAGKTIREMVPDLDESWFRVYGEVAVSRKAARFENPAPAMNRWFDVYAFPMGAPDARLVGLIFRDITGKKTVEEECHRVEERCRLLSEATNDVTWDWDMVNHRIHWSGPVKERLGIEIDDIGTDLSAWADRIHPDERAQTLESLLAAIDRGDHTWSREYAFRRGDGSYVTIMDRGYIARDSSGTAYRMIGSALDVTGRRRAEDALRLSEAKLNAVIEALPVGIGTCDGRGHILSLNKAALDMHGFGSHDEMLRRLDQYHVEFELRDTDGRIIPERDWPISKAIRGEFVCDCEIHLRRLLTDEERIVLYSVVPIGGETRWLPRVVFVMHDITERKQAEAAVELARRDADAQRRLLDAVLESLPVGVIIADPTGRIVRWNHATENLWGLHGEHSVITKSIEEYRQWQGWWPDTGKPLEPEEWVMARSLLHREVVTGELVEIARFDDPSEHRVIVNMGAPVLDESGEVVGAVVAHTDVTERIKIERALRESEERFRALADNIPQLAWMSDENGFNFWYNRRWLEYSGATVEQLKGWGWRSFLHPDFAEGVQEKFRHHTTTGEIWEDTFPIRARDGSYRWFLSRAVPIRSQEGKPTRWFGSATDITAQREARQVMQDAKEEAERASKAKDEFLASLSHELRTPLTPVLMAAQMLEADASLPEYAREDLHMLRRNVELETRLIDDLLDLTRISRGKLHINHASTDLHTAVRHAAETCLEDTPHRQRLKLVYDLAAANSTVWGDSVRLRQIFWNVIRNAVKFTSDGGTISVRSRNPAPDKIEVTVADTGVGIEPDVLPHIFTAFEQGGTKVTRRFGGLGLGLAICRSLAELHGGKITAHSAGKHRGAEFTLQLPLLPKDDPRRLGGGGSSATEPEGKAPEPCKILLVEDHEHTAMVLERVLVRMGHEVRRATTVSEALGKAAEETFSFVLSDVGLPDGNGHDLMRELHRRYGLRGIAISGYGMEEDIARSREAGFEEHLVKPVDLPQLSAAIRRIAESSAV